MVLLESERPSARRRKAVFGVISETAPGETASGEKAPGERERLVRERASGQKVFINTVLDGTGWGALFIATAFAVLHWCKPVKQACLARQTGLHTSSLLCSGVARGGALGAPAPPFALGRSSILCNTRDMQNMSGASLSESA